MKNLKTFEEFVYEGHKPEKRDFAKIKAKEDKAKEKKRKDKKCKCGEENCKCGEENCKCDKPCDKCGEEPCVCKVKESKVLNFNEFSDSDKLNEGKNQKMFEELKAKGIEKCDIKEIKDVFMYIFKQTTENLTIKINTWLSKGWMEPLTKEILWNCLEDGYKENYASIIGIKNKKLSYLTIEEAKKFTNVNQGSIAGY